jgi:hypothetical protein
MPVPKQASLQAAATPLPLIPVAQLSDYTAPDSSEHPTRTKPPIGLDFRFTAAST